MELARTGDGLAPDAYTIEPQLAEISFGDWEGYTIANCTRATPGHLAARA